MYWGMWIFFSVKLATSLLASLAGRGIITNQKERVFISFKYKIGNQNVVLFSYSYYLVLSRKVLISGEKALWGDFNFS